MSNALFRNALFRNATWRIIEEFSHSDHKAILCTLIRDKGGTSGPKLTGPKWRGSAFDKDNFEEVMGTSNLSQESAEGLAKDLMKTLVAACDVMPRRTANKRGALCYWWNEKIQLLEVSTASNAEIQK